MFGLAKIFVDYSVRFCDLKAICRISTPILRENALVQIRRGNFANGTYEARGSRVYLIVALTLNLSNLLSFPTARNNLHRHSPGHS